MSVCTHPFRKAVEERDERGHDELLADDVVFTSPVAFKPYVGKPITAAILRGVLRVFEDFRYIREINDRNGHDHALVFEAMASGKTDHRLRLPALQRRRSDRRLHGDGAAAVRCDGIVRGHGRPVRPHPARGCRAGRSIHHRAGALNMRIGLGINYAGGFKEVAAEVADLERAGLDIVFVPEAYSFDAVSALGYLAASHRKSSAGLGHPCSSTPERPP